jgi:hypothetical protein
MAAARSFSNLSDPFTFERGWANALVLLCALVLTLILFGATHVQAEARPAGYSAASALLSPTAMKPCCVKAGPMAR